jgi:TP901 family phage tail tape measure protein
MHLDMSSLMEIPVQYEYIMAQVKGITGASEADFERLKEAARQWGGTTMYSATEVGEAMTYMGMAGWETQAVLDGIGGVLDAATIGCMDLGQASDFVTDGLTAMGLSAKKSNDFVDLLAGTIVNSNTGMSQLQKAYGNVGSLAGEHNVAISELNTALGLMANKGVKGAKAGTAMKNLFSFLAAPSDKSASIIKQYCLQEAQDMILKGDLLNGIKAIKAELNDLSPKEKDKVLTG